MIVKTSDVFCDVGSPKCEGWCVHASATGSQGGTREARAIAKAHGWRRINGQDVCPGCQKVVSA